MAHTDLTRHMTIQQQRDYIRRQQEINAGLAQREAEDAERKADLARQGHNTLIVRRMDQEAELGVTFAAWRKADAMSGISNPRGAPRPPAKSRR